MSGDALAHGRATSHREGVSITMPGGKKLSYEFSSCRGRMPVKEYLRECVRAALEEDKPQWLTTNVVVITIREDVQTRGQYVWAVYRAQT